jgi:hypothetical protein
MYICNVIKNKETMIALAVNLSREVFERDLETCLTILKKCKDYYLCEYISPLLKKKIVKVFVN